MPDKPMVRCNGRNRCKVLCCPDAKPHEKDSHDECSAWGTCALLQDEGDYTKARCERVKP